MSSLVGAPLAGALRDEWNQDEFIYNNCYVSRVLFLGQGQARPVQCDSEIGIYFYLTIVMDASYWFY